MGTGFLDLGRSLVLGVRSRAVRTAAETIRFRIPALPSLVGTRLHVQGAVVAPGVLHWTNMLRLSIE